jgi:hypothetical protein
VWLIEANMAVMNLFTTTTSVNSPLDASNGTDAKPGVSDFLTVQALTNFAAMTGAITAAWNAVQKLVVRPADPAGKMDTGQTEAG